MPKQINNPLHGITLQTIVENLFARYGWKELATRININCFKENPSIKSSLTFYAKLHGQEKRWKTFIWRL
jgi:uncharacterized protein (DUF2132 family)